MKAALVKSVLLCFAFLPGLDAQQNSVSAEWDINKTLAAIAAHAERLEPFFEQIQPQDWVAKGAPDTYVAQWKDCRTLAQAIATSARSLSRNPDKLTDALQVLFRIQSLGVMLGSLGEGIRKYQNPAIADLLSGVVAENGGSREKLQQYILELAGEKEQQFRVADQEAQRCREFLSRQPSPDRALPKKQQKE